MPSRAHGPEPCASANFATRANQSEIITREGGARNPGEGGRDRHTPSDPRFSAGRQDPANILVATAQMREPLGILDSFEKGLERAVNGAFAKTFKSGLQPVEITSALRRELDTKAAVVDRDRILAPNRFTVRLSAADHERITSLGDALTDELVQAVQRHANSQGYQFAGGISVAFRRDESLSEGVLRVDSGSVKGEVSWTPVLDVAGKRYPLVAARTIIGRGSEADITVDDTGISRKHVEITWDGSRAQVVDLGSTNGSQLNGERVTKATLAPDSVIQIGRTSIVFRVLPQASSVDQYADRRVDEATKRHDGFWGAP